jgi:hypothetical protein
MSSEFLKPHRFQYRNKRNTNKTATVNNSGGFYIFEDSKLKKLMFKNHFTATPSNLLVRHLSEVS